MILRRLSIRVIVAGLTFLLGVGASAAWLTGRAPEESLRVSVPGGRWVHIFFDMRGLSTKSINEATAEANLPSLRTVLLPEDDLEVRFWCVANEYGRALVLRRSHGEWSAIHLRGMGSGQQLQKHEADTPPKSGWEKAWGRLVDAGILTLPDAEEANCRVGGLDGVGYIVELNTNKTYRTYMYDNPDYAKCREAKQMVEIADIMDEEFGWQLPAAAR